MPRIASTSFRCCALLLAATLAHADPGVPQLASTPMSAVLGGPDLRVRYELLPQGELGRALLRGELEAGGTRLRTQVHLDPSTPHRATGRVDLSLETPAPGPLQAVTIGDGYTSGAGWSPPSRLTGLRIGRPLALRAPLRADPLALPAAFTGPSAAAPGPAFAAQDVPSMGWDGRWRDEARRLNPAAHVAPAAPTAGDPVHLGAGATDYEFEAGRLREGWDTADRRYLADYGAAAYRAGLGFGLTAEARTERSGTQTAQGLELLQALGGGASLQAIAAQSETEGLEGQRRGVALAGSGDALKWRVAYTAADRDFRSATGGAEAREGVRVETTYRLSARTTAQAALARQAHWDGLAPESTLALGTDVGLTGQVRMRLDLARRVSADPAWRAGVTMSMPLD